MGGPRSRAVVAVAVVTVIIVFGWACGGLRTGAAPAVASSTCAPADSGYVTVDDGRLYYEAAGHGPPVVLIHGGLVDRRLWDGQLCALARAHRVVRYDQRGFGRSERGTAPISYITDLDRVVHALGLEQPALVGLSLGGSVALEYTLAHPSAVGALVLASSSLPGYPSPRNPQSVAAYDALNAFGLDSAIAAWLRHQFFASGARQPRVASAMTVMLRDNAKSWAATPAPVIWPDPPAIRHLEDVHVPTLVITGDEDVAHIRAIGDTLASRIRGATRVTIPGVDHHLVMEAPDRFNRVVLDFLNSVQPPRT